jgi:hypothetical protein
MEHTWTETEIREYIEAHDDTDRMDYAELLAIFRSIYGRDPEDDERCDIWSWICNGVSHQ